MTTNVVYLPREFFRREQNCREKEEDILDSLSRRLRELNLGLPVGPMVTQTQRLTFLRQIRGEFPDVFESVVREREVIASMSKTGARILSENLERAFLQVAPGFAWSKQSNIYHESRCSVVATISPANLQTGTTPPVGKTLHKDCPK